MPGMTKEYCKSTPINKMGFSQRSSCKALGIIPASPFPVESSLREFPIIV